MLGLTFLEFIFISIISYLFFPVHSSPVLHLVSSFSSAFPPAFPPSSAPRLPFAWRSFCASLCFRLKCELVKFTQGSWSLCTRIRNQEGGFGAALKDCCCGSVTQTSKSKNHLTHFHHQQQQQQKQQQGGVAPAADTFETANKSTHTPTTTPFTCLNKLEMQAKKKKQEKNTITNCIACPAEVGKFSGLEGSGWHLQGGLPP